MTWPKKGTTGRPWGAALPDIEKGGDDGPIGQGGVTAGLPLRPFVGGKRFPTLAGMPRRRLRLLPLALALVVGTGCAGQDGAGTEELAQLRQELQSLQREEQAARTELAEIEEAAGTAPTSTSTTTPESTVADSSAVGLTLHRNEFKITVLSTKVTPNASNPKQATLEIPIECENVGKTEAFCPSEVRIESDGEFYAGYMNEPRVPAGRKAKASYSFTVDEKFSLAKAVLRVGRDGQHIAVIPLCAGKGSPDTVTLAPVSLPASGTLTAGQVTASLKGLGITADYPNHQQREAKKLTLYVTLDVTANVTEDYKGYYLDRAQFSLKLPNGNTAQAEDWSFEGRYVNTATTETDTVLQFEINNPPAGSYALQYAPRDHAGEKVPPASASFTIG